MDPLRGVIHLGLKLTEATLDRALDVVRLADTLLVAGAVPPAPEVASDEPTWPAEEQADLDALSATLRARQETGATKGAAKKSAPAKKSTSTKGAAKKSTAKKSAPAKKTTPATKTTSTKRATATSTPPAVLPDA